MRTVLPPSSPGPSRPTWGTNPHLESVTELLSTPEALRRCSTLDARSLAPGPTAAGMLHEASSSSRASGPACNSLELDCAARALAFVVSSHKPTLLLLHLQAPVLARSAAP